MGYRYAIIGTGRQGLSAAYDLARLGAADEILLCDLDLHNSQKGTEKLRSLHSQDLFKPVSLNAEDPSELHQILKGADSAIRTVPFALNLGITQAAIKCGANLCDLGGHTDTVIKQLAIEESILSIDLKTSTSEANTLKNSYNLIYLALKENDEITGMLSLKHLAHKNKTRA